MLTQRNLLTSITVVLSSAMAVSAQALPQPDRPGAAKHRPLRTADSAIVLLNKRVDSVKWIDKPFEEVADWMRDESDDNVDVVIRWTALNVESIDRDSTITLDLRNTTVGEVLQEVLDQLSEDGALGFHAWENKIKISTKSDFDRKLYLRVYNATDILFHVPDMGEEAPQIDLQTTVSGSSGGGGQSVFSGGSGGGSSGGSLRGGKQAEQEFEKRLEALATLIQDTIAPETWDTGQTGGRGRIRVFNRSLVVLNTIEVQETIAGSFSFGD